MYKPNSAQQIAINADHLCPQARELENQITEEKKRWLWFDSLCIGAKPLPDNNR